MNRAGFINLIKGHIAEAAVGASALRNQGAKGLVQIARDYFKQVDLKGYSSCRKQADFNTLLDKDTETLQDNFPRGARNWGIARKSMNLFLRDALYNRFLCTEYELHRIEKWMEVPLDGNVAAGLMLAAKQGILPPGVALPKWSRIKRLTPEDSWAFQQGAQAIANREGIAARVHVDLLFWRNPKGRD